MGLGFLWQDVQNLRMQGNQTFLAFEQRILEAHAAQMLQLQLNNEGVERAFRVVEQAVGDINSTLHTHHNRHLEIEQGFATLLSTLRQVQDDEGKAALRVVT